MKCLEEELDPLAVTIIVILVTIAIIGFACGKNEKVETTPKEEPQEVYNYYK